MRLFLAGQTSPCALRDRVQAEDGQCEAVGSSASTASDELQHRDGRALSALSLSMPCPELPP